MARKQMETKVRNKVLLQDLSMMELSPEDDIEFIGPVSSSELKAWFIPNKYARKYFELIRKAKNRAGEEVDPCLGLTIQELVTVYRSDSSPKEEPKFVPSKFPDEPSEKHHILPKSFGGANTKKNMVKLTCREHYLAHLLLTKMTEGDRKRRMSLALTMFNKNNDRHSRDRPKSHWYSYSRKLVSETTRKRIPFYASGPNGEYIHDNDLIRFCEQRNMTRLVGTPSKPRTAMFFCGVHRGWILSLDEILDPDTIRNKWTPERERKEKNAAKRRTPVVLQDPNGIIHTFKSLTDVQKLGPVSTIQHLKDKLGIPKSSGKWKGWIRLK